MLKEVRIAKPFDAHLHLRDGDVMASVLPATLKWCSGAIIMPNLSPPVVTARDARIYKHRIIDQLPKESSFQPVMTCYLTEDTDIQDLLRGFSEKAIHAVKYYPANATTNSDKGVRDIKNVSRVLSFMEEVGIPLLLHGEVVASAIGRPLDFFSREKVFVEGPLEWICETFPKLRIVLEHISTDIGVQFVKEKAGDGHEIRGTITPHHLIWTRTDLFDEGIRPDRYCMPIVKGEIDRTSLRKAATSGSPLFFLGTDSAPHDARVKYCACGKAGVFNAVTAIQTYLRVFEEEGVFSENEEVGIKKFENFCSILGPRFYGLEPSTETLTITREPWKVPEREEFKAISLANFLGGETLNWQI